MKLFTFICFLAFLFFGLRRSVAPQSSFSGKDVKNSQLVMVSGRRMQINKEGCAEASLVCGFASVAGGHGGGECETFFQLTGKTVQEFCKNEFKETYE